MENFTFNGSDENFNEILFKTSLLSLAIYEDDPVKYLNDYISINKIRNTLGKICVSEIIDKDDFIKLECEQINIRYLISKNDNNKTIIVAFKGEENLSDILRDGKHFPEIDNETMSIKTGLYKKCFKIYTRYFYDKLIDNYKVIFTGYSMGGALAAMETVNLFDLFTLEKFDKNILFIGYGCPYIAEITYASTEEQNLRKHFLFIRQEDDLIVHLLDYLIDVIYFQRDVGDKNLMCRWFRE